MKTILKTAAIAALITGFANTAQAMDFTPLTQTGQFSCLTTNLAGELFEDADCFGGYAPMASRQVQTTSKKTAPATIAVARLHEGSFLPLPHQEASVWAATSADKTSFTPLSAGTHFDILPEIAQNGVDSDNKIDEIRLTAAASGQDYVLIYAVNDGAGWGRFGDRDLDTTGLAYDEGSHAVRDGDAKALLVKAYTGEVIGAVTTFAPDMETLTRMVAEMAQEVFGA